LRSKGIERAKKKRNVVSDDAGTFLTLSIERRRRRKTIFLSFPSRASP